MADEYVSSLTEEQFEKALVGALNLNGATSPQQALAALGAGVRPNLLVNGYFQSPVNQRGSTLYSGAVYGIDGWRSYSSSAQMEIVSNGISLTGANGVPSFFQKLEDDLIVAGTEFTFSAFLTEITGTIRFTARFGYGSSDTYLSQAFYEASALGVYAVTFTVPENATTMRVGIGSPSSGSAVVFATKLEYGSDQTLAYQGSSGVWNLLPQPDMDYSTQLAKCQAFYEESNENVASRGVSIRVPPNGIIYVPFKVPKRVIPAITVQGNDASYIQTSYITINGFTAQNSDTVNLRAFDYSATAEL